MNLFFFFNDTATTEIYTLSLHDALPICLNFAEVTEEIRSSSSESDSESDEGHVMASARIPKAATPATPLRSEEHTSELQSHLNLVCRLLLEKKKKKQPTLTIQTAMQDAD